MLICFEGRFEINGTATFVTTTDPSRAAAEHRIQIIGLSFIGNRCWSIDRRLQPQDGVFLIGPLARPPLPFCNPGYYNAVTGRCPGSSLLARYLLSYLQRSSFLGSLTLANSEVSRKILQTQHPGHGTHRR